MPCFCPYLRKQLSVHILRTFRTHICIMNHAIPTITISATINFKTVHYVEGRGKKRDLIFCQITRDTNYIVTLWHKYILWPSMVALMRCILQRKEARYFLKFYKLLKRDWSIKICTNVINKLIFKKIMSQLHDI